MQGWFLWRGWDNNAGQSICSWLLYGLWDTWVYAIFKNKEDAEACAKIMTKNHADIDCYYDVYEKVIYSSLDESMKDL